MDCQKLESLYANYAPLQGSNFRPQVCASKDASHFHKTCTIPTELRRHTITVRNEYLRDCKLRVSLIRLPTLAYCNFDLIERYRVMVALRITILQMYKSARLSTSWWNKKCGTTMERLNGTENNEMIHVHRRWSRKKKTQDNATGRKRSGRHTKTKETNKPRPHPSQWRYFSLSP